MYDATGRWVIYRWLDRDGDLLYLGITCDMRKRTEEHRLYSWWFQWADRVTISEETFESEEAAGKVEQACIATEEPIFNMRHSSERWSRRQSFFEKVGFVGEMPDQRIQAAMPRQERLGEVVYYYEGLRRLIRQDVLAGRFDVGHVFVINQVRREHFVAWGVAFRAIAGLVEEGYLEELPKRRFRLISTEATNTAA